MKRENALSARGYGPARLREDPEVGLDVMPRTGRSSAVQPAR